MSTADVTIVGAGPYGLAAAAHLRARNGLDIRVFGEPMSFWEEEMPKGMLLRSPYVASNISDPGRSLTLDAYQMHNGDRFSAPVPLERFVDYGKWFQQHAAPNVDPRRIDRVEVAPDGFRLVAGDDAFLSRRVVIAAGIRPFPRIPEMFRDLSTELASHVCGHRDFRAFADRRVAVIGGGQSALESAALLHESGADVEVLVRSPVVHWLGQRQWLHELGLISRLLYAPPDVGPIGVSRIVATPDWFRLLPRRLQDRLDPRSIRPAGSGWLRPRLADVPITTGRFVAAASRTNAHVRLLLDDQSERHVDHVLLGTGYQIDIAKYAFLERKLLAAIGVVRGYPRLSSGFESTVRGLYFLGAPAAWSFGPLMRFVAGTDFAAGRLAKAIHGALSGRPGR